MTTPLRSGTTALDLRQAYQEGWQRWARHPKQVVLDPAGGNLHDIFLDPLELNSVDMASWNHRTKRSSIQDGLQENVGFNEAERQERV